MRQRLLVWALVLALCGCAAQAPPSDSVWLPPDSSAQRRAAFAEAYQAWRIGEGERALPVFLALADGYRELADYALYFAATIARARGDDGTAERLFTRMLRDYPQSVRAPAAALELGQLLVRSERIESALPLLEDARTAPDAATAQRARLVLAQVDEQSGNISEAYAGYMEVRRTRAGPALAREAKQRVLALRAQHPDLRPAGAALLDEARLLLTEHDYAAAQTAVQSLLEQREVDPAAALRIAADALYGQGEVEAALTSLRQLVDRYPHSAAAPGALFRLGSVLWNRDRDTATWEAFEEFERNYADDAHAPDALYAIGRIHENSGDQHAALESFTRLTERYPRSTVADEARWHLGWIRYRAGEWAAAASAFARFASQTASTRLRNEARYWQARALERAGEGGAAQALYRDLIADTPADYYSMWAERRLGLSSGTLAPMRVEPAAAHMSTAIGADLVDLQSEGNVDAFHVTRWAELKAAGTYSLAREELAAIERGLGDDSITLQALLRAYQEVEGFAAAQRLLRRSGDRAAMSDAERQRLLYPLAFWAAVSRAARESSVDPLLIEAVMRQESLFDPEARSPANAYGLMQLLPATASRVAATGDRAVDPPALMQPDLNIDLGTRYLNGLLKRFDGDLFKAIAAYNGGEAAVDKWERRFGDLETDEFVESISYRETRDYVKRVVTNYRTYQQIYAAPGA